MFQCVFSLFPLLSLFQEVIFCHLWGTWGGGIEVDYGITMGLFLL